MKITSELRAKGSSQNFIIDTTYHNGSYNIAKNTQYYMSPLSLQFISLLLHGIFFANKNLLIISLL